MWFAEVVCASYILSCASIAVAATVTRGHADITFDDFLSMHNKTYPSMDELKLREALFDDSRSAVVVQNAKFERGDSMWWATVNNRSDWTEKERASSRMAPSRTLRAPQPTNQGTLPQDGQAKQANPPTADWMWAQTAVKDQGGCGSCWAFATTEVLESYLTIAGGNGSTPLILAPQTLVDCVKNPNACGGTGGCEGATAEIAFNYTRDNGIALERQLPYTHKDGACPSYTAAVKNGGYVTLAQNSASALETALARNGPVAITVAANWDNYGGGIFEGGCKMPILWKTDVCNLDHAVVAVGYTSDYWLVRNSWGSDWGERGYIRLTRKNDNATFRDEQTNEGVACRPYPKYQYPMGESGCLFDMSYPTGVRKVSLNEDPPRALNQP